MPQMLSAKFSSPRSSSAKPIGPRLLLPRPPRLILRRNDFHPFAAAPPGAAAPRFLEGHQKSERRILELQMAQHVPMLSNVLLQIRQHVAERDDAARWNFRTGRKRAERDEAH